MAERSMLVECVPNISEGRDSKRIASIVQACTSVSGVSVLHVDSSIDANRTVLTFTGSPTAVLEGAFRMYQKAQEVIDMRTQTGTHPRIGAVDVCPFVPIRGVEMIDCVVIAKELGQRVSSELEVPVFFYEQAATRVDYSNLAYIRRGEFEGLSKRFNDSSLVPDMGHNKVNPSFGATVIGARDFLIAFNVNLDTHDTEIAKNIAASIRESGVLVRTKSGELIRRPGICKGVKAIGWFMKNLGYSQISTNITDYKTCGLREVYEACKKFATQSGANVIGAEIVGLVPSEALLNLLNTEIIRELQGFNPEERTIEAALLRTGCS